MDMNTKLEICRLKFCGESVISISEITGFTKQCIYTFIRKFPRSGRSVPVTRPKDITEEQVKAYCRDYISGYSPQEIAERYGVTEETILQLFYYISGRRVVSSRPKYYNALAKWMRSHGYSQRTFAAELGIPISRLKDVFAGYRDYQCKSRLYRWLPAFLSSEFSFLPVFLRIQAPWFFGSHYTTLLLNCQFVACLFAGILLFFCELESV